MELLTFLSIAQHSAVSELSTQFDAKQLLGIPVALVGAVLLSFGAQYQSRGLNKVERITGQSAGKGLSLAHIFNLFKRPSWVIGTGLLGLATLFQIWSLSLSPIIVVQPIGVVALVVTAILNTKFTGVKLGKEAKTAITMSALGISAFVLLAAFFARDVPVTDQKLITILILFLVVLLAITVLFIALRQKAVALAYIIGAGVIYGFVATFAKTVIGRLQQDEFEWLTWLTVGALLVGALLGMAFVQNAYSSGPPDLVVAGLTVIDPLIAVMIGIVILQEAQHAPWWVALGFIASGAVAIAGVVNLARYHPQTGASVIVSTNTGEVMVQDKQ